MVEIITRGKIAHIRNIVVLVYKLLVKIEIEPSTGFAKAGTVRITGSFLQVSAQQFA
jgi:hypothetical protein